MSKISNSNIKYYSVVLSINTTELTEMYRQNHQEEGSTMPTEEELIQMELDCLNQSGISVSGALEEISEE